MMIDFFNSNCGITHAAEAKLKRLFVAVRIPKVF